MAWDHPRSRGKDFALFIVFITLPGSPPLAREGPHDVSDAVILGGDHPRSRGKDIEPFSRTSFDMGSPPLAREGHTLYFIKG